MNSTLSVNFSTPLDPQFQLAVLFNRAYVSAAKKSGRAVPLVLGLKRENGLVSRYETLVLPEDGKTRWGGSQYLNSSAQGNYENYVCDEIVSAVESRHPAPTNGRVVWRADSGAELMGLLESLLKLEKK